MVCGGTRPTIPGGNEWPIDIITLMRTCWCHDPHTRPTFSGVVETLRKLQDLYNFDCWPIQLDPNN